VAIDAAAPQASDRVYYLYQTMADISEALSSSPEGAAALESAQRQVAALAAPQQAQQQHAEAAQQQQQQPQPAGKAGKKAAAAAASSPGVELLAEVRAALADDFNTPLAIAALSAPLKAANDLLHTKKVGCCFCCWMQPFVLTGCFTRLASIAPPPPCPPSFPSAVPLAPPPGAAPRSPPWDPGVSPFGRPRHPPRYAISRCAGPPTGPTARASPLAECPVRPPGARPRFRFGEVSWR